MTRSPNTNPPHTLPKDGLSRFNDIAHLVPVSRSTVWRMVKAGKFPKPTRLSSHCTVWKNQDILDWLNTQGSNSNV